MPDRLDPTFVRAQIELLLVTHPQIWDDGDTTLLTDTLEGETSLHEFLAAVVDRMDDAEAFAAGLDMLLAAKKARRDRFNDRSEAMRALAFKLMNHAGVRKLELAAATLSIRAGQPRVIITDEAALPENCVRIKREPNKTLIRELIDQGVPVPGASLSNSEPVLSVRVK